MKKLTTQQIIEKGTKSKNPLEIVPNYDKYICGEDEYYLYCKTKADMTPKTIKWAFKLAENNVAGFYKACSIGWQPKIKQSEMNRSWARYYIAKNKTGDPVAFAMFRFDWNYELAVLYCYEMHVQKEHRRKGLGKFIMKNLEECAKLYRMEKIVLTVLTNNQDSIDFFQSLGYTQDESYPTGVNCGYDILSKQLVD